MGIIVSLFVGAFTGFCVTMIAADFCTIKNCREEDENNYDD